jgi:DNA-3-methyladenine glycosylase II
MSNTPTYWNAAKKYLSKKDKVMSSLISKYKSPSEKILTTRKDVFFSLCKSIIGQQISVAAGKLSFFTI